MASKISKDEILRLAKLSRLEFSEDEIMGLLKDMKNIMKLTAKVEEYENDKIYNDSSINIHQDYEKPEYDACTRDEILSGGINKNGFFFIKKY